MDNNLQNEKFELEMQLLKIELDNIEKNLGEKSKRSINWELLVPLVSALIGGAISIIIGLDNQANLIEQKKLEYQDKIIQKALDAETIEESRERLIFYSQMGLLTNIDSLEEKLKDSLITIPGRPPKLNSSTGNRILLIDNIARHYRGKENMSNADDIWQNLRKSSNYRNKTISLVIDRSWNKNNIELIQAVKDYQPKLIIMHLSSFFHKKPKKGDKTWPLEIKIIENTLMPFLVEILKDNQKTKVLLYSTKNIESFEYPLNDIISIAPNRILLKKVPDVKDGFLDQEPIELLNGEIESMIN